MDFQYWLYIIIGIIYLISALRKKAPEQEQNTPDQPAKRPTRRFEQERSAPSEERQMTFEELLREITEGKSQPKTAPVTPPKRFSDYSDYKEEAESLEDVDFDYRKDDKTIAAYEEAKNQAFTRPSLEDSIRKADNDLRFGRFKEFEQQTENNLAATYLADLKDLREVRKAIVMSEILQRKF